MDSAAAGSPTKKPIYKRWWFLALAALLVVGIVMEATKSPERRAAEEAVEKHKKDSVAAREKFMRDSTELAQKEKELSGMAYVIAKNRVKEQLKFPRTARFPFGGPEASAMKGENYVMRGRVTASNAFGVPSDYAWIIELQYRGGAIANDANWSVVNIGLEPIR